MKRIKRVLLLLLAGFLAFAPPGTLVVSFILLAGLLRNRPFVAAGILAFAALLAAWLLRRRLSARRMKLRERDASRDQVASTGRGGSPTVREGVSRVGRRQKAEDSQDG